MLCPYQCNLAFSTLSNLFNDPNGCPATATAAALNHRSAVSATFGNYCTIFGSSQAANAGFCSSGVETDSTVCGFHSAALEATQCAAQPNDPCCAAFIAQQSNASTTTTLISTSAATVTANPFVAGTFAPPAPIVVTTVIVAQPAATATAGSSAAGSNGMSAFVMPAVIIGVCAIVLAILGGAFIIRSKKKKSQNLPRHFGSSAVPKPVASSSFKVFDRTADGFATLPAKAPTPTYNNVQAVFNTSSASPTHTQQPPAAQMQQQQHNQPQPGGSSSYSSTAPILAAAARYR
ncbi:hypothetical protein HK101_011209, partial [Irineochytrium annulatum]